jgi:hypothetical protein
LDFNRKAKERKIKENEEEEEFNFKEKCESLLYLKKGRD